MLTSVTLSELQVLPLDSPGQEQVRLLLFRNILYGHVQILWGGGIK